MSHFAAQPPNALLSGRAADAPNRRPRPTGRSSAPGFRRMQHREQRMTGSAPRHRRPASFPNLGALPQSGLSFYGEAPRFANGAFPCISTIGKRLFPPQNLSRPRGLSRVSALPAQGETRARGQGPTTWRHRHPTVGSEISAATGAIWRHASARLPRPRRHLRQSCATNRPSVGIHEVLPCLLPKPPPNPRHPARRADARYSLRRSRCSCSRAASTLGGRPEPPRMRRARCRRCRSLRSW